MLDPAAIVRFVDKQKQLLRQTYDDAWQQGVGAYEPDEDPVTVPNLPRDTVVAGLTGVALLMALRQYPYESPSIPDPVARAVALAPAFNSLNRMGAELTAVAGGNYPAIQQGVDASQALTDWADSNAWRLAGGESAAWAGEQAGFAQAATSDGMLLWSWETEGDERVCPDCELLSSFPPMPLSDWPTAPGSGDTQCNAGCFPPGTRVAGVFEGGLKARYKGPMVYFKTRDGFDLTLTPNHPVATPEGFVPAGTLRQGDYVLVDRTEIHRLSPSAVGPQPQQHHTPVLIEDVFTTLLESGVLNVIRPSAEDLYGEAGFFQGNVDVVHTHGALLNDRIDRVAQRLCQLIFPSTYPGVGQTKAPRDGLSLQSLCRNLAALSCFPPSAALAFHCFSTLGFDLSPLHEVGLAQIASSDPRLLYHTSGSPVAPVIGLAQVFKSIASYVRLLKQRQRTQRRRRELSSGFPSSAALTLHRLSALGLDLVPFDGLRLGAIADMDVALTESAGNSGAADSQFVAECIDRHSGLIASDEIVHVQCDSFDGHVYDLQSPRGWVAANGILAANCRCSWDTADANLVSSDYSPDLSAEQQDLIDTLSERQLQALADMMPDAAYLS